MRKISAPPITDTGSLPAIASASSTLCATSTPSRPPVGIAREDDMPPSRQEPGQAVERLAAHDQHAAHGQRLEPLEIGGDVPRQPAILADHAVAGAGDDQGDRRPAHALTAAVIR